MFDDGLTRIALRVSMNATLSCGTGAILRDVAQGRDFVKTTQCFGVFGQQRDQFVY